jgi:hypothetical protein
VVATAIGGGFSLIVLIAIPVINFWAVTRIIHQAGYSRNWILVPLTPFVLFIAVAVDSVVTIHDFAIGTTTGLSYFEGVSVLWSLFAISLFVTWIFFLVFAFSTWPVSRDGGGSFSGPARPAGPFPAASPTPPLGQPRGVTRDYSPPAATSTATTAGAGASVASPPPPTAKSCVWCAELLPGSRALFHDCGSKDRPPVFCAKCGSTLTAVGDCASCGAGD